ncbi:nicotinate-nucleotide pyrophosphorylase [carboxylating] [Seinonella peptonophila]|uniref:Probable nicotinate-nucleotide pyrophosphorylase [carboxylating] n=1 Tax=Seinonella peptonophila TaxID=112248 RepID=A0A1M5A798_9BACL|nr:carboxylating nicotinate-nucleotide diphosphorylase [Seinonella peptonophila]SHF26181.1 nicotinate-nucleotide pyrophosphorylase [carboxylating] [Seinonella peptonophila]
MNPIYLRQLICEALNEDIGAGDLTTEALVPANHRSQVMIVLKQAGVVAGLKVVEEVFRQLDAHVKCHSLIEEGKMLPAGTEVAQIEGNTRALLTGERVALNLLQRMSGIATVTRRCVDQLQGLNCDLLDTRKTMPGWRMLERYAVRIGGGKNHRYNLNHAVMIKDNHIAMAGGLSEAVERIRSQIGPLVPIEVEADRLDQVEEALQCKGISAILLDNMDVVTLRKAVQLIESRIWTEASGGITEQTIRPIAETGVNGISLGWLTHSASAIDLGIDYQQKVGEHH